MTTKATSEPLLQPLELSFEPNSQVSTSTSAPACMPRDAKEAMKGLVLDEITRHCRKSSPIADLRALAVALEDDSKSLGCSVLSGGATNYSYRVFMNGCEKNGPALFAKLTFPYALWNPDPSVHHDLVRTQNEFDMMNTFARLMCAEEQVPVATPYVCLDILDHSAGPMKLLVTEWAGGDSDPMEQLQHQFKRGDVSSHAMKKLAIAFATLNSAPVENPAFNENTRPCITSMFGQMKDAFAELLGRDDCGNACVELARVIGDKRFNRWIDVMDDDFMSSRDTLIHNDAHCFNILVGQTSDNLYLCDWEMALAGPSGSDVGKFQAWPMTCALVHAIEGNTTKALHIVESALDLLWTEYAQEYKKHNPRFSEEQLCRVLRNAMGWNAFFLFAGYYMLEVHVSEEIDFYQKHSSPENDVKRKACKNSIGVLSLQLMQYGYGNHEPQLALEQLHSRQKQLLLDQIDSLAALNLPAPPKPQLEGRVPSSSFWSQSSYRRSSFRASLPCLYGPPSKRSHRRVSDSAVARTVGSSFF